MQTKNGADEALYGFVGCTVRQFMTRTVITVNRRMTMRELAALYEKHDFNAFPVVEDGMLVGIISKFDFLRAQRRFVDAIGYSMAVWLRFFASKTVTCGLGYLFFISFAAFSAASYVPNPDFNCRSTAT